MLFPLGFFIIMLTLLLGYNYLLIDFDKSLSKYQEEVGKGYDKLVTAIDNELVVAGIGTFENGDDPKVALNSLCAYWQGIGEYSVKMNEGTISPPGDYVTY